MTISLLRIHSGEEPPKPRKKATGFTVRHVPTLLILHSRPDGLTHYEAATIMGAKDISIRRYCQELANLGFVEVCGRRKVTTHNYAKIFRLTASGILKAIEIAQEKEQVQ